MKKINFSGIKEVENIIREKDCDLYFDVIGYEDCYKVRNGYVVNFEYDGDKISIDDFIKECSDIEFKYLILK